MLLPHISHQLQQHIQPHGRLPEAAEDNLLCHVPRQLVQLLLDLIHRWLLLQPQGAFLRHVLHGAQAKGAGTVALIGNIHIKAALALRLLLQAVCHLHIAAALMHGINQHTQILSLHIKNITITRHHIQIIYKPCINHI